MYRLDAPETDTCTWDVAIVEMYHIQRDPFASTADDDKLLDIPMTYMVGNIVEDEFIAEERRFHVFMAQDFGGVLDSAIISGDIDVLLYRRWNRALYGLLATILPSGDIELA